MTITVNITEADLADLLARVEAGEEVILARDDVPVARMMPVEGGKTLTKQELYDTILRERTGREPVTQAEIAEWKQIGRR